MTLQHLYHLVRLEAPDHVILTGVLHNGGGQVVPQHIWWKLFVMMISQDEDVRHHQADDHQGLQGDQASQIVDLCECVTTRVVTVTEIMEYHDNNHEDSIANREDVERCSADVLCADIKLEISLR